MRTPTRFLALGASVAAVLIGSASTAMADSQTIKDKRYDVLVGHSLDGPFARANTGTYHQHITSSTLDAKKLRVNYGKDFVSLRLDLHRFTELDYALFKVKLNGGPETDYYVWASPLYGANDGSIVADALPSAVDDPDSLFCASDRPGPRIRGSATLGKNGYLQVYVPRACFENPKLISVNAMTIFEDGVGARHAAASMRPMARAAAADPDAITYVDPVATKAYFTPKYTRWLARN
jgi:hypothetical protein